jgi:hypothetical protein
VVQAASTRLAAVLAAAVLAAGCTGGGGKPGAAPSSSRSGSAVVAPLGGNRPGGATSTANPSTPLARALAAVPPSVLYASFTNLAAMRRELGFDGVDSQSPAGERFAFWEAARASGTLLTGTRLYDNVSVMADDYGWTADDVVWEIDFAGNETGCSEDMLCDPSGGSVLALRDGVTARAVIQSLAANGFELPPGGHIWSTERAGEPFSNVVYLPELNAVALGNAIGLIRVSDVAGGAPSLADQIPSLAAALGSPLSAYIDTTGCVSVGEALGPEATDGQLADYVRSNDPSRLAPAKRWAVTIDSRRTATSFLDLGADGAVEPVVPAGEQARRKAVLDGWRSIQAGVAFDDVATAAVSVDGPIERVNYDVTAMSTFAAMVLTHDAPWALCATSTPT